MISHSCHEKNVGHLFSVCAEFKSSLFALSFFGSNVINLNS